MKKPIFIHIPKAGGSSIQGIIKKYNNNLEQCLHRKVSYYPKHIRDSCFVFTFTRNPYDRLLSAYVYLKGGYGNNGDKNFGETLSPDFKTFILRDLSNNLNWLHFRPISFWLDGNIDFIGKIENYIDDFNIVCDRIGIPRQQLLHINKTQHKHYTEYYDSETREIVAEKYAEDIEYFGYKFGE